MTSELEPDIHLIEQSGYFDASWYISQYPGADLLGMSAVEHYLKIGARLGNRPSNSWDPQGYLREYPDIKAARLEPLTHYLRYGKNEGRVLPSYKEPNPHQEVSQQVGLPSSILKETDFTAGLSEGDLVRHVLLVSHDGNIGGAPNVVLSLAQWFTQHTDFSVSIICMEGGPIVAKFQALAPTLVLGSLRIEEEARSETKNKIAQFLTREPSFVILNSVASGGFLEVNTSAAPVFAYIHEMPKLLEVFKPQLKLINEQAKHIFCNGVAVRDALASDHGVQLERLTNYPSFIDVSEGGAIGPAEKERQKAILGFDPSLPMVVGCGVVHWRKQPELFVTMAAKVLGGGRKANFVWVGDGPDKAAMEKQVEDLGLHQGVHFVGHKDNFRDYLAAADVFALTSIEDPFPLVVLEAGLLAVPSVFFKEAGATWTFATPVGQPPAGVSVPLDDHEQFIQSVGQLIAFLPRAQDLGAVASRRVISDYSRDVSAKRLLGQICEITTICPRVSIIVPNYNCARFLEQRLESISRQTFHDYEIILLDDASKDKSLKILQQWQHKFPRCSLHVAKKNSGSPFLAWRKGIDLAKGELIWIAEADDYCEPDMLRQLVAAFKTRAVKLAYAQSLRVGINGESHGSYAELYLNRISYSRWDKSYIVPAFDEINVALGRANSIPNASAVVTRQSAARRAIKNAETQRLAGDWTFYVTAIHGGLIAYCYDAINYHRAHLASVTSAIEGSDKYFQELADTSALVRRLYGPNMHRDEAALMFQSAERERFKRDELLVEGSFEGFGYLPDLPGLLYCVGDLSVGGAQTFAARFVKGWAGAGAATVLAIQDGCEVSDVVLDLVSNGVTIVTFSQIENMGLSNFLQTWGLSWILSGHWWADRAMGKLIEENPSPMPYGAKWAIVMHGCYETVIDHQSSFPGWQEDFTRLEKHCEGWIWLAHKNRRVFENKLIKPKTTQQIVSGFHLNPPRPIARSAYGIPDDALVFTIASRAIEEKGWLVTQSVFEKLSRKWAGRVDSRLLMVGAGPAKDLIEASGERTANVQLLGFINNVDEIISLSDVCLLPSWFSGESLPLTIIEALAQGKPAIVSDIGLSSWSISTTEAGEERNAGFVVTRDSETGQVNDFELSYHMEKFFKEPGLAKSLEPIAKRAFEKFDFNRMMGEYVDFFRSL